MTNRHKISFRAFLGPERPSEPEQWLDVADAQIRAARNMLGREGLDEECRTLLRGAWRSISRAILLIPRGGVPHE